MKIVKVGDNRQNKPQEETNKENSLQNSELTHRIPPKKSIYKPLLFGGGALILLLIVGGILYATVFNKENGENEGTLEGIANLFSGSANEENGPQNVRIDTIKADPINKPEEFIFEGVYPRVSGLRNKDFEEELNKIFKDNVNRFITVQGDNGVDIGMGFDVLTINDSIISIVQSIGGMFIGSGTSCGIVCDAYTVNANIISNVILTNNNLGLTELDISYFNNKVLNYFNKESDYPYDPYNGFADNFIPQSNSKNDLLKFNYAIKNGSLALVEYAMPSACVSKGIYTIPIKKFGSNNNSITSSGESNTGNSDASGPSTQVSKWINALGDRDFSSAYNLMSPSMRGSYSHFASNNSYGGITNTKIYNVETVSTSGCRYEVVAIYDSYDPSNRDGKYTQRFSINNCNGNWVITKIKNISVDYYR